MNKNNYKERKNIFKINKQIHSENNNKELYIYIYIIFINQKIK